MIDITGLYEDPDEVSPPNQQALGWLHRQGISPQAAGSPWALHVCRAIFDGCGGYQPIVLGDFAWALPVTDDREIVDIVAWAPSSGEIGSRLGIGCSLGEGEIGQDGFGTTGLPLRVWRNPLGWLLAERQGIVIVDVELAAHRLAGLGLQAEDWMHADELRRVLCVPPPVVLAPSRSQEPAA